MGGNRSGQSSAVTRFGSCARRDRRPVELGRTAHCGLPGSREHVLFRRTGFGVGLWQGE
jgi:hypothetical protein